jgi:hypothetical protein
VVGGEKNNLSGDGTSIENAASGTQDPPSQNEDGAPGEWLVARKTICLAMGQVPRMPLREPKTHPHKTRMGHPLGFLVREYEREYGKRDE